MYFVNRKAVWTHIQTCRRTTRGLNAKQNYGRIEASFKLHERKTTGKEFQAMLSEMNLARPFYKDVIYQRYTSQVHPRPWPPWIPLAHHPCQMHLLRHRGRAKCWNKTPPMAIVSERKLVFVGTVRLWMILCHYFYRWVWESDSVVKIHNCRNRLGLDCLRFPPVFLQFPGIRETKHLAYRTKTSRVCDSKTSQQL